jgi:hypothetical protein
MEMDNLKQMIKEVLGGMEERMNADRKSDQLKMAADIEDLLTRMKEARQANQELLARMDGYHEKRMAMLDAHQKRIMATKKTEYNPEMMQFAEEHQEILNEDVVVRPAKGLKKRHRVTQRA